VGRAVSWEMARVAQAPRVWMREGFPCSLVGTRAAGDASGCVSARWECSEALPVKGDVPATLVQPPGV
jgi:hypothetical protein